jgi:hypothetical protein
MDYRGSVNGDVTVVVELPQRVKAVEDFVIGIDSYPLRHKQAAQLSNRQLSRLCHPR